MGTRRYHGPMRLVQTIFLLLGACFVFYNQAHGVETVTLQLKWSHAFQFAGYYAAQEKGYYRELGLDVYFREAIPGVDPTEQVITGQAQYGVGTSSLLLARWAGKPVVVLAVIFQHSPFVLIARQQGNGGTQTIHDLQSKRVMFEPQSEELIAYLKQEGIRPGTIKQQAHSFDTQDLIDGRVDAMSAYVTSEPYFLERAGIAYQVYTPRSVGIDFYGDNLFTSEIELKLHPERVRAFRQASLRGWEYAMAHPDEIVDLILKKYSRKHPRDFYLYEAQKMLPLLRTDLLEPGYMTSGRWQHIANTYAELGLLPSNVSLAGFLYEPESMAGYGRVYSIGFGGFCIIVILIYVLRLRFSLAKQRAAYSDAEAYIKENHFYDAETGLPGRKLFEDRVNARLADMRRHGDRAAIVHLRFQDILANHNERDAAIHPSPMLFARWLNHHVREADTVARFGASEWAVLLARLDPDESTALAQVEEIVVRLVDVSGQSARLRGGNGTSPPTLEASLVMLDSSADAADVLRKNKFRPAKFIDA